MRIVVTSDNHGLKRELNQVREKYPNAAAYIHCGDSEMTNHELNGWASVRGNNDYYAELPASRVVNLGSHKIFVTHSHLYPYFNTMSYMVNEAKNNGCDILCFGHIHRFVDEVVDGIRVINPGSMRYNRDGSTPCYALIDIEGDEIFVSRIDL